MTTAIFDPTTRSLFADSQVCMHNMRHSVAVNKIKIVNHALHGLCLFVATGAHNITTALIDASESGSPPPPAPADDSVSAMMLTPDGVLYETSSPDLTFYKAHDQSAFRAIGSGTPFAYAVYKATNDPVRTMEIVKELDIYTGGATVQGFFDAGSDPVIVDLT